MLKCGKKPPPQLHLHPTIPPLNTILSFPLPSPPPFPHPTSHPTSLSTNLLNTARSRAWESLNGAGPRTGELLNGARTGAWELLDGAGAGTGEFLDGAGSGAWEAHDTCHFDSEGGAWVLRRWLFCVCCVWKVRLFVC